MATSAQRVVEPYEEQEPFLWDSHRYYGFISGVGAGKTAAGVIRTALNAELWNRGDMGAIVAPSSRMIKNAIFPVMADFGLRDRWEFDGFQAEEPGFHTPEDGRIVILSADNERTVERLANLNLAYWWLDEAKETPRRAREILQERLRTGEYRNGYITTTPSGYDHNYDFFVGDGKEQYKEALETEPEYREHPPEYYYTESMYGDGTVYETFENRLCVAHVPSWANPHTPEDFHAEMRTLPEELRLQQAEGRFVEIGAGIFTREMLSFVSPDDLQDTNYRYVIGVDVGVEADSARARERDTDYWAATLLAIHPRHPWAYVLDARRERGLTLTQGVEWVQSIAAGVASPKIYVESNQAQRWLKQELADAGLNAVAITNTTNKEDRLIQISIPLERETVQFVDFGDDRFDDLIAELLAFPEGSHDDLIDSFQIAIDNSGVMRAGPIYGADPYDDDDDEDDDWRPYYG